MEAVPNLLTPHFLNRDRAAQTQIGFWLSAKDTP